MLLKEAVTKLVDGSHNPPPKRDFGKPMLSARNIENGRIVFDEFRLIDEAAFEQEHARSRVSPNDVLLTIVGTIGRTAVVPEGSSAFALQRSVAVLTPRQDLDPKYLCYQLQSPSTQRYFEENARGTAQKGVYLKTLGATPIIVPTLDEQRRIVAEIDKQFSRLDEAVANLQRVKANLKRYKAAVLKAAVEGRLVETEASIARSERRVYETGEQLLHRILKARRDQWTGRGKYKEPEAPKTYGLPDGPEGWAWASYAQLGSVITGFTPPTSDPENFQGFTPFFKPTDLDAGDNVSAAREHLSEKGLSKGRRLPAGSVLVTCIGATIGKTGLATVECATNQQINAVVPHADLADARFVYWWTCSPEGQNQIVENASATTLPIISKGKFEVLSHPVPPMAEQRRIVSEVDRRMSIAREVEADINKNLQRASSLRQAALAKVFAS